MVYAPLPHGLHHIPHTCYTPLPRFYARLCSYRAVYLPACPGCLHVYRLPHVCVRRLPAYRFVPLDAVTGWVLLVLRLYTPVTAAHIYAAVAFCHTAHTAVLPVTVASSGYVATAHIYPVWITYHTAYRLRTPHVAATFGSYARSGWIYTYGYHTHALHTLPQFCGSALFRFVLVPRLPPATTPYG